MGKKKQNPYEEIENNIITELNQHKPGTPEYKAILENFTTFKHSMEETRTNQAKELNEKDKLSIDLKKIEIEHQDREKDREQAKEEKEKDRELEKTIAERNRKAENFKAKHQFQASIGGAILTAIATILGIGIANSSARKRTREVLHYEETGIIASNGGKNTISNTLKPIKG